jgi:catechol 2,3-dioxygenase-like lactoylglutathione lyase family enzyme
MAIELDHLILAVNCILISEDGTQGGDHLAFALSKPEFEAAFARLQAAGVAYGDRYDSVGSMRGPGRESGARGMGNAVYFFDPNRHLIEIRHYE